MTAINEFQKAAAMAYAGGEYAHYGDLEDAEALEVALEGCGDSLFRAVMLELSDDAGCDAADEASRRMTDMIRDLGHVRDALAAPAAPLPRS